MTDAVATGPVALPLEKVAHLVALSETFRAGRTWQDALAESIDYGQREVSFDDIKPERPFAVCDVGTTNWRTIAGGVQNCLRAFGDVWLWLEHDWPIALANDPLTARRSAANWFGDIIAEIAGNAGRDVSGQLGMAFSDGSGDLSIIGITQQTNVMQTDPDEFAPEDRYFMVGYQIEWGDG